MMARLSINASSRTAAAAPRGIRDTGMLARLRVSLLADIPDGKCSDRLPQRVVRRKHPVIPVPVPPGRWDQRCQPVKKLKRRQLDDTTGPGPRRLPRASRANPVPALVPGQDVANPLRAVYELAFQMQAHAPDAVDLSQETAETKALYGLDDKETAAFGRNCLLARRLVERGVRFVQCYHGAGSKWDAHKDIEGNHAKMCREMDKPVAGLLTDLKRCGLLDDTLVVWGGEFGRTPMSEKGDGRDHNPTGFTMWMAGGGVRGGTVHGTTDEIGLHAVENRLHVHDLHSTILDLLGLDHKKLVYFHGGRPERIDANEGHVYKAIAS
jgi:hypothetical protein